jgi:hypothetical protein
MHDVTKMCKPNQNLAAKRKCVRGKHERVILPGHVRSINDERLHVVDHIMV